MSKVLINSLTGTVQYPDLQRQNIVRYGDRVQGCNQMDMLHSIRRDLNVRHISVENSSKTNEIGFAISIYLSTEKTPPIQYTLKPGESIFLAVNPNDSYPQFLYIIDAKTNLLLGDPQILATNANIFVLREGLNKWWVQKFFKHT